MKVNSKITYLMDKVFKHHLMEEAGSLEHFIKDQKFQVFLLGEITDNLFMKVDLQIIHLMGEEY